MQGLVAQCKNEMAYYLACAMSGRDPEWQDKTEEHFRKLDYLERKNAIEFAAWKSDEEGEPESFRELPDELHTRPAWLE